MMQDFAEYKDSKWVGRKLLIDGPVGKIEVSTHLPQNLTDENLSDSPDILIMCHPHPLKQGTMDNKVVTSSISAFNQEGAFGVRFNFRGVGQTSGVYDKGIGESEDLIAVYNWVKSCFPKARIFLGGFSFGTYVAYRAKDKLDLAALLLLAPAISYEYGLDFIKLPDPKDDLPLSIVMGDADEVVSPDAILDWVRSLSCGYSLVKLKGVSHFFHHNLKALKLAVKQFYYRS
jgi:uncharacterized protein